MALARMDEAGIIRETRPGHYILVRSDLPDAYLGELAGEWRERDRKDREKLDRMEAYARSALCRWWVLRDYFGEEGLEQRCGVCDNCRKGLSERAEKAERSSPSTAPSSQSSPPFKPGDRVSLPKYGDGTVQAVDGDALVVRFPGGRSRKFKSEFAQPVRPSRTSTASPPAPASEKADSGRRYRSRTDR